MVSKLLVNIAKLMVCDVIKIIKTKNISLLARIFIFIFIFIFGVGISHAEKNVMRIATINDFSAVPEIVELITKAYGNIGYKVKIFPFPARRAIIKPWTGIPYDAQLMRVIEAEKMLPNYIRIPVVVGQAKTLAYAKDENLIVEGWNSLSKYRIAALRGYVGIEPYLQSYDVDYVNNATQAIKMLRLGRVQIAVLPEPMANSAITELGIEDIHVLEPPLDTVALYHYLHEQHAALVPELTTELRKLVRSD